MTLTGRDPLDRPDHPLYVPDDAERDPFGVFDRAGRRTRPPRKFGAADIAQDRKQPRLHGRSAITIEMSERA